MDKTESIVSREQWGAVRPRSKDTLKGSAEKVVIHHTALPSCKGLEECKTRLVSIQKSHMTERQFDDIGYNFLVGADGTVFEGRGWGVVGAHAKGKNHDSLGIAFMGNFCTDIPSTEAIMSVRQLLQSGVARGYLNPEYSLLGHRDLSQTKCPGDELYAALQQLRESIVSREQWGAVRPRSKDTLKGSAEKVVIHHTALPSCKGLEECKTRLVSIQKSHMTERRFDDIGYNFLVGADGTVFEGRGWGVVGAHAKGNNHDSLGIAFMGNFCTDIPSTEAIMSVRQLLQSGVARGYLNPEYSLLGHRDLSQTKCPGDELYAALQQLRGAK